MTDDLQGRPHGVASTYVAGCRCRPCTQEWARVCVERIATRKQRLAVDPSLAVHGLSSTYTNWGCRCPLCTAAHTIKRVAARKKEEKVRWPLHRGPLVNM